MVLLPEELWRDQVSVLDGEEDQAIRDEIGRLVLQRA